jgi:hypothetical protein
MIQLPSGSPQPPQTRNYRFMNAKKVMCQEYAESAQNRVPCQKKT